MDDGSGIWGLGENGIGKGTRGAGVGMEWWSPGSPGAAAMPRTASRN